MIFRNEEILENYKRQSKPDRPPEGHNSVRLRKGQSLIGPHEQMPLKGWSCDRLGKGPGPCQPARGKAKLHTQANLAPGPCQSTKGKAELQRSGQPCDRLRMGPGPCQPTRGKMSKIKKDVKLHNSRKTHVQQNSKGKKLMQSLQISIANQLSAWEYIYIFCHASICFNAGNPIIKQIVQS